MNEHTGFFVRERKLNSGKWMPDASETMCVCDSEQGDAEIVLLDGYEDDAKNYRVREYVRLAQDSESYEGRVLADTFRQRAESL